MRIETKIWIALGFLAVLSGQAQAHAYVKIFTSLAFAIWAAADLVTEARELIERR